MNRRKRNLIVLVAWLAGFFLAGYGVWSFQGGELMLLAYLGLGVLAYVVYAFAARCPHCRWPILLRPRRPLGIDLYTWSFLPPARCRHCGRPL
jgi:hypothetical protein